MCNTKWHKIIFSFFPKLVLSCNGKGAFLYFPIKLCCCSLHPIQAPTLMKQCLQLPSQTYKHKARGENMLCLHNSLYIYRPIMCLQDFDIRHCHWQTCSQKMSFWVFKPLYGIIQQSVGLLLTNKHWQNISTNRETEMWNKIEYVKYKTLNIVTFILGGQCVIEKIAPQEDVHLWSLCWTGQPINKLNFWIFWGCVCANSTSKQ